MSKQNKQKMEKGVIPIEYKYFFGSKKMNIPKKHKFNSNTLSFELNQVEKRCKCHEALNLLPEQGVVLHLNGCELADNYI